jgi:hypothetical protein
MCDSLITVWNVDRWPIKLTVVASIRSDLTFLGNVEHVLRVVDDMRHRLLESLGLS